MTHAPIRSNANIAEAPQCELCATTQLVALFQPIRNWLRFSKPVRQFMRIETDCPSQSKGGNPPACRHLVDMLGCDLKQFRHVPRVKRGPRSSLCPHPSLRGSLLLQASLGQGPNSSLSALRQRRSSALAPHPPKNATANGPQPPDSRNSSWKTMALPSF